MKKILLVVLVTSITGAFAAIQWNCTTDLDSKYIPQGCIATPPIVPVVPTVRPIESAMFNGVNVADCIITSPDPFSSSNTISQSSGCLSNKLSGMTFGGLTTSFFASCAQLGGGGQSITCSPGVKIGGRNTPEETVAYILSQNQIDEYNNYQLANSSVKIPDGAFFCYNYYNNTSNCPHGSYAAVFTSGSSYFESVVFIP